LKSSARPGVDAEKMVDALYAFTDCETTISQPHRGHQGQSAGGTDGVSEVLRENTEQLVASCSSASWT
jgi:hypothetical protein